jgi:hypothetical protein
MRATIRLAAVLLLATACNRLDPVPPGTVVSCGTAADCPSGRVCNRSRCILPSELGAAPDLVLVDGRLAVTPPAGRAGTAFTVTVEATKELEAPPRVILSLDSLVELPCAIAGARTYRCTYTATGAERGGLGGHVTIDVRMVDLVGQETARNGVGGFDLDFAAPVLAARSVAPESVALGGVLQVFFTSDEDLGAPPVLTASRHLDEAGDGLHFTPTRQPGTRNYLFTHLVTAGDAAGPVDFSVDLTDAVGNHAASLPVGSLGVDPTPPVLSGLAVTPARLAASGTLTVTFDASEAAAPGSLAVTVGGRPLSCGAWAATSPSYTCTRAMVGDELAGGTEAVQSVVVGLADLAGNRATTSGSVVFDFKAPALSSRSAGPANVPLGGTLVVSLTPDEDLGANPTLVASRTLDAPGGTRFTLTREPGSRSYQFTHVVTANDPAGQVDFTVELSDVVGNGATGVAVGSLVVDNVAPTLSAVSASPARLGASGTLSVTFSSTEPGAPGTVAVTVGGRAMACGAWSATPPSYTCTRAMAGNEIAAGAEAAQSIAVALADGAGNRASASGSAVVFDFKAPGLAGSSAGPARVPLGGTLVVSFTPDEDLGPSPVLVASPALDEPGGGTRFTLTRQPGTRNYQFTHVVTTTDVGGTVTFTAEATDLVGNAATGLPVGSLVVDNVAPTITGVAATPARLGASGTLTVTFSSSEPAATGTLAVTVGGRAMTCGAYSATPPSYTCTRAMTGTEIPAGTEAAQSVAVALADAAGNRGAGSGSAVVFDFKAPALSGSSAEPAQVPLGGVLLVSFTPDESLGSSPVLVASRALDEPGLTRFTLTAQPGTRNYLFTHLVTLNDTSGPVIFTAELTDGVGNVTTGVPVGTLTIDTLAPLVSSVAVAPARIGRTGTLMTTFDVDGAAAPGTLAVTVGGLAMACGSYRASPPPNYTCTRAMTGGEIPLGTEAIEAIVIGLADAAGNLARASASAIFDFKPPTLAAAGAGPANVPLGGAIVVTLTPDEDLLADPVLIATWTAPTRLAGGTVYAPTRILGTRNYTFTYPVSASDRSGPITFTANLADPVGNAATGVAVGTVVVDVDPIAVGAVAVSPARIRSTGTVTVTFDAGEAAAPGTLSATVGGLAMSCGAYQATSPRYTCTRAMAGNEIPAGTEAAQSVVVSLADAAGNRTTASGSIVFDFKPPAVASAAVAYAAPDASDIPTVARATAGSRITVTVLADEALDTTGTPALVARLGGLYPLAFTYQRAASTATSAVFDVTVPPGQPDGDYTAAITWTDLAGNGATTSAGVPPVRIKTSAPALVVNQAALCFVRSPWGNSAPVTLGSYPVPAGPYYAVEPGDPLSPSPNLPAGALTLAGGLVPSAVVVLSASDATAQTLGTLRPSGGLFPRRPLVSPDLAGVWLVGVDDAGNRSAPVKLQFAEWVATPNPPDFGASPHVLSATGALTAPLVQELLPVALTASDAAGTDAAAALAPSAIAWQDVSSTGIAPRRRDYHAMANDTARGRVVLFGGYTQVTATDTQDTGETWEWDGTGWTLAATTGPSARRGHAMAYDSARGRVVLFGGNSGDAGTWEWDGVAWVLRATAGPVARQNHAMAYDAGRGVVVLFGGSAGGNETWEWDGHAWTLRTTGGPPARTGHALAYDQARGQIVLFGGTDAGGNRQDTWVWNGTVWTNPANSGPAARYGHGMTWDGSRGTVVLHGGTVGGTETWSWNGSAWLQIGFTNATSVSRSHFPLVYDTARARLFLFGGYLNAGQTVLGDTWVWVGTPGWAKIDPSGPTPRYGHAAASDTARSRVVLFGGYDTSLNASAGDTWEWNGSGWWQVSGAGPTARQYHAMAYDAARGQTVLFGGTTGGNETWTWNGSAWTLAATTGPSNRAGAAMAYDAARGLVVLFGGSTGGNETWTWNGSAWTLAATTGPSARTYAAMAYDTSRSVVVLFGGTAGGTETWEWSGSGWTLRASAGPSERWQAAMAYDSSRGRVLLNGGYNGIGVPGETWEWNGAAGTWTLLDANTGVGARSRHVMAYDATRSRLVLFGGYFVTPNGLTRIYYDDTWLWQAPSARQPAIQFGASSALLGVDPSYVGSVQVRAYAGSSSSAIYTYLYGWANRGASNEAGAWSYLGYNTTSAAATPPYLPGAPASLVSWRSPSAVEARRYVVERGALTFQVRPSGSAGLIPDGSRVALDFIEVRVRYTVP